MLPYYFLVGLPALLSFVTIVKTSFNAKTITINSSRSKNGNKAVIDLFFFIWLILLIFRNKLVGIDLLNYEYLFQRYRSMSFGTIFAQFFSGKIELGYALICKIIYLLHGNFQCIIIVFAFISVIPIWLLYRKSNLSHPYLAIVLFLNLGLFSLYFSTLRQVAAMAFVMPAYKFTKEKRPVLFLITIFFAFLFHSSAMIFLLFYPVYHLKLNRKSRLLFILLCVLLVYVFNVPILRFLIGFLNSGYIDKYGSQIQSTGAYTILLLLIVFLFFAYLLPNENELSSDIQGLRNILVLCILLQTFASIHTVAMRMNYYFLIFIPILIVKSIDAATVKNRNMALIAGAVMVIFFTSYYLYTANNGADILHVYPYIPFWRNI